MTKDVAKASDDLRSQRVARPLRCRGRRVVLLRNKLVRWLDREEEERREREREGINDDRHRRLHDGDQRASEARPEEPGGGATDLKLGVALHEIPFRNQRWEVCLVGDIKEDRERAEQ